MNIKIFTVIISFLLGVNIVLNAQHQCGHDHPAHKAFMKNVKNNPPPTSAQKSAMACKKIRVYWIVPNGGSDNSARRKYCEIGTREIQQQWSSQGRTAYFENMVNLYTNYTIQDFVAAGGDNWFSFAIDNVIIPQVGANGYNSRTLFFVDGNFSTCCAFGAGGDAGWAGLPNWAISGIENYITNNNYNSRADIGAIAHELGHAFNMPHEDGGNGSVNCDNQCAPKGIMCNGGSPSPCGAYYGYPSTSINGWNNGYFNSFPEYFTELGGSCNGPVYVGATGGNSQVIAGQEYVIRGKGSNKVLTATNGNIVIQDYTGSANQRWIVGPESYGLNTPEKIRYQQIINVGSGQAIDNYAYNMDAGGNIVAWGNNQQNNQYWRLINRGGGYYAIQNLISGRIMDVQGGSTAQNANVQQWNWNGSDAQLWSFESPCIAFGGDSDGDGVCNNQDQCPNLNNNLIGTSCDDNNPGTANDLWQSDCTCVGTPICTEGDICDGEYGPNTGTYDANCNCITAPCSDADLYAGNCDFDGDGILNGDDQDDDNDGILDTEECPVSNVITNSSFDGPIGNPLLPSGWEDYSPSLQIATSDVSTGAGGFYPPNVTPQNSSDGAPWAGSLSYQTITSGLVQQVTLEAGNAYTISFEQANFGIDLTNPNFPNAPSTGSSGQYELLIDAGTSTPTTIVGVGPIAVLGPQWSTVTLNYTAQTTGVHTLALANKYMGSDPLGGSYLSIDNFQMKATSTNCDIDNDGISNELDLDSDNDDCADALEGGATIASSSVGTNGQLTGGVDPNTGIPVIAAGGQSIGDSQNENVQNEDCVTVVSSKIQAKVFLEGFFNGTNGLVKNADHAALIPNNQPFNTAPWNYNGNESTNAIPSNAVDWILLVTRDANGNIQEQKAGFIATSGEIMDTDGTIGVSVNNVSTYFSIHHKSHLAVMSSSAYTSGTYDFTNDINQAMGTEQLALQGGRYMMYSGDYDCNGIINNVDFNNWKTNSATLNQYLNVDGDGNGIINNLDYNLWTRNRSKIGHPPLQY